jgi:putative ABC transport system permease protein
MFFRLLLESFVRQRRRKALAGIAILLGTTAVTAMLALATTIGDRIHAELAVYGANIVVTPQAAQLDVKIGGTDIHPATGNAYLHESDLAKLRTIFWANNITGISPELDTPLGLLTNNHGSANVDAMGIWFKHKLIAAGSTALVTGAPQLHPSWKLAGSWPSDDVDGIVNPQNLEPSHIGVVVGTALAEKLQLHVGDILLTSKPFPHDDPPFIPLNLNLHVTGIVSTGDANDSKAFLPIALVQSIASLPNAVSRVEISARTKPEDAFARRNPDSLTPAQYEIWRCRPYANSIARDIQEAIPGADAQQVRRVEQSEGTVLSRISGLMWLISAAALLAAGFAVSAAMATAILERRAEIGLMRSLGAAKSSIALLFYAETGILALIAGTLGYLLGCGLAAWLGSRIFAGDAPAAATHFAAITAAFIPVLLPVSVGLALLVAIAGSTPAIRAALRLDPANILRTEA